MKNEQDGGEKDKEQENTNKNDQGEEEDRNKDQNQEANDEVKIQDNNNMTVDDEGQESDEKVRRVMFQSDKWEDCIRESVWFGQKIP